MDDVCTVFSVLAAQHPEVPTCPRCGEVLPDDMALQIHVKEHDEPKWETIQPTEEWGDLEDHGWMGTSIRNNPTIRDDFPASFG
jgi:hypothetical protein